MNQYRILFSSGSEWIHPRVWISTFSSSNLGWLAIDLSLALSYLVSHKNPPRSIRMNCAIDWNVSRSFLIQQNFTFISFISNSIRTRWHCKSHTLLHFAFACCVLLLCATHSIYGMREHSASAWINWLIMMMSLLCIVRHYHSPPQIVRHTHTEAQFSCFELIFDREHPAQLVQSKILNRN